MAPLTHSVEIDRRPEDVFAYVTDPRRFTEWQDSVASAHAADSGPLTEGSKIVMTRRMGKRMQTVTSEITAFDPSSGYAFKVTEGPVRAHGKGRFEPLDGGSRTRFTFELDFSGHGMGKALVPLARKQAQKELLASHAKLKNVLESDAT